jgi:hypothetical protein
MNAKERHKIKLIEYIGNPDNDFPGREQLGPICGVTIQALRKHFSVEEFQAIEKEGLELRRKKYARQISYADQGLLKKAAEGDPQACKLVYQRFESWSERQIREHTGKNGRPIEMTTKHGLSPEAAQKLEDLVNGIAGRSRTSELSTKR